MAGQPSDFEQPPHGIYGNMLLAWFSSKSVSEPLLLFYLSIGLFPVSDVFPCIYLLCFFYCDAATYF